MTSTIVRFLLAVVALGIAYALLVALPDLPSQGVNYIAESWHLAYAFNRVWPVDTAFTVLGIQLIVTAGGMAVAFVLAVWKRVAPLL